MLSIMLLAYLLLACLPRTCTLEKLAATTFALPTDCLLAACVMPVCLGNFVCLDALGVLPMSFTHAKQIKTCQEPAINEPEPTKKAPAPAFVFCI